MLVSKTNIDNLLVVQPQVFHDERGYFFESFSFKKYQEQLESSEFVQDNESFSSYGVLRGLHLQIGEHAQSKLVRVIKGIVLDVAVDLREGSKTFGQHYSVELSADNKKQLYIPRNFAHGFVTLSKEAILQYKCDNYYNKESERGLNYADPTLAIDWQLPHGDIKLYQRDQEFPALTGYIEEIRHAK